MYEFMLPEGAESAVREIREFVRDEVPPEALRALDRDAMHPDATEKVYAEEDQEKTMMR